MKNGTVEKKTEVKAEAALPDGNVKETTPSTGLLNGRAVCGTYNGFSGLNHARWYRRFTNWPQNACINRC